MDKGDGAIDWSSKNHIQIDLIFLELFGKSIVKIAYDSQIFCAQKYGGVSRYFSEISKRIDVLNGGGVSILSPMSINAYLENLPASLIKGFTAPQKWTSNRLIRGAGLLLGDLMLRQHSPDLIHETYYSPFVMGPRSTQRITTVHDMIHEKFPSNFPRADRTTKYKRNSIKRASHVICVSHSTRRDLLEMTDVHPDKVSVVHHGYELPKSSSVFSEFDTQKSANSSPYLLFVGHRAGYKNFDKFFQAFAASKFLSKNFRLVCFGGGEFTLDEKKKIQSSGLSEATIVRAAGSDSHLSFLYKNAAACIYPSLYEGFGMPLLEAMAHDCPVICSETSSMPEVAGDASIYFNPNDVDSMRYAMEKTLNDQDILSGMKKAGRQRLDYFSWDRCAQETLSIYKNSK